MSEKGKPDFWDSTARFGGIVAGGIVGSVFAPAVLSALIGDWIAGQLAASPAALVFSSALAALAGAGVACSIAIPVLKRGRSGDVRRIAELEARLAPYEDEEAATAAVLDAADGPVAALLSRLYEAGAAIAPDDPWSPGVEEARPYLVARGLVLEVGGKLVLAPIAERRIRETPGMADRLGRAAEACIKSYREGEAMLAEMSADIEYRRRRDADCAALASEPYWQKVMLACLRDKGKVILFSDGDIGTDQLEAFVEGRSEAMGRFVRLTTVGAAGTRAELSEEGEDALRDHPELLQGVDWGTFSPIDREFAHDPGSSPFTVTCQGMQWLVNVDL